jgi:hypothetical protein
MYSVRVLLNCSLKASATNGVGGGEYNISISFSDSISDCVSANDGGGGQ